ncbi:MAG: NAD(P)/FAD-dependent oxidoreductase [Okeania sp. SIO2G4]|uniref:NAD(P)/FAD-dependent oxidoreductase n=1 Tax=unclassified Okeania TaxID=2634635 RepID=UPI0013B5CAB7|nr:MULTISPECIES: NAD(P)/FAD-dependent oxidoreductase [unclassified Okeania]NEP38888.1 NAD(P)/FAD-dependent oxidoreductase [Okeania sp. SIO2H7]NEP74150.1 NAD(P)/FAD-dependent oxidoreductase [Okeania sp. SIO2G5]NEP95025.1 NAD(P)/FAD-dependent oxidoreductase [Okeania sp. SIO2F5]NEQ92743.1 NAD(P)/FAD-dependent oxidoreductase [Okeania sp. SIO2G4]
MTEKSQRICILGGGFGGLYTALRLIQFPWQPSEQPEIILIDQRDRFLFAPLLYELVTGELQTWEIAPPFEELFTNTNIRFCQGVISEIDINQQQVKLENGQAFSYDRLVLAMGGETPMEMVKGAAEYAIPFRTIDDAYRLQEKLRVLEASDREKIRVAIAGGGYSGVELACKLADRLQDKGRIRLVERSDMILRTSPEFNREAASQALSERNIWIDLETEIESIEANQISLKYKGQVDTIPVDIVLWTVGTKVAPVVKSLPLKKNQRDQIITSATLQVQDNTQIFALGDLADCQDADGQKVPTTAQVAIQQSDYVAWNIWASVTGRPLLPFRYQPLGEMMALGLDNATLTSLGIKLDGQVAHLARRLVYLYRLPTLDHQMKVAFNWIVNPIQEALSSFSTTNN